MPKITLTKQHLRRKAAKNFVNTLKGLTNTPQKGNNENYLNRKNSSNTLVPPSTLQDETLTNSKIKCSPEHSIPMLSPNALFSSNTFLDNFKNSYLTNSELPKINKPVDIDIDLLKIWLRYK